jgi:hypothetical protein
MHSASLSRHGSLSPEEISRRMSAFTRINSPVRAL